MKKESNLWNFVKKNKKYPIIASVLAISTIILSLSSIQNFEEKYQLPVDSFFRQILLIPGFLTNLLTRLNETKPEDMIGSFAFPYLYWDLTFILISGLCGFIVPLLKMKNFKLRNFLILFIILIYSDNLIGNFIRFFDGLTDPIKGVGTNNFPAVIQLLISVLIIYYSLSEIFKEIKLRLKYSKIRKNVRIYLKFIFVVEILTTSIVGQVIFSKYIKDVNATEIDFISFVLIGFILSIFLVLILEKIKEIFLESTTQ